MTKIWVKENQAVKKGELLVELDTDELQAKLERARASGRVRRLMWTEIQRQANMLAFIDAFYALMIMTLCIIPLIFLFKSGKSEKSVDNC